VRCQGDNASDMFSESAQLESSLQTLRMKFMVIPEQVSYTKSLTALINQLFNQQRQVY